MKEKQPTSAQHMRELLKNGWKSIPGDYLVKLVECAKSAKGGYFLEYKIYFDLFLLLHDSICVIS